MTEEQRIMNNILNRYENGIPSLSRAFRIIDNIDIIEEMELSDKQLVTVGAAIKTMLDAPTINSINKEQLRRVIRFLWNMLFEWEENNGD